MENRRIKLRDEWTIRGGGDKFILFNFKKGLCEDRFSLSREAYTVLRYATGEHTDTEVKKMTGISPSPYVKYLLEQGVVEFSTNPIGEKRFFQAPYAGKNFLGRIMLHLTGRCNLKCKHCYIVNRDWGDELTFEEVVNLLNQAAELNVASISITGGEPFVRKDLLAIVKEIDKREIKIEGIFTNATIISENFLKEAMRIQEFPFFVSINGSFTKAHDGFMGVEGSFDKTLKTIAILVNRGIKVFANTSLSVFVDNDQEIERFYELVKTLGIYRWRVSTPFLEGNWRDNSLKFGITIERELQIFLKLLQFWLNDAKPFDLELGHIFRYVAGEYSRMAYKESDYLCDYFRERIVILPNGEVGACPLLINPPYLVGNIRERSLKEIWQDKRMRYFKDLRICDILVKKCHSCSKLSECGVGCRANSVLRGGRYEDIDPEICEIYSSPIYNDFQKTLEKSGL